MKNIFARIAVLLPLLIMSGQISAGNFQSTANQDKRLALVIGNGKYEFAGELANPVNDARSMKRALESVGFEVLEYENLSKSQMKQAIDNFGVKLRQYSTGLFFYAGHGIQSKNANYLIPVDANLQSESVVDEDCVKADRVLGFMEEAGTIINIVILDACRNNPFERSWSRAIGGSGLAFMDAPSGSLIAYSTSPGRTASDGSGSNGLYTEALLENIKTPGVNILQMFQNVRRSVSERSGKKQIPWESTSLTNDFFFTKEISANSNSNDILWKKSQNTYWLKINGREIGAATKNNWYNQDLMVFDPETNLTCILPDYNNQPDNRDLKPTILGSASDAYWTNQNGILNFYLRTENISTRIRSIYVENDVLAYDPVTNISYMLRNYKGSDDNKLRPAEIFAVSDFAFCMKKGEAFWLMVKGEYIESRTKQTIVDNDLLVYDGVTNTTYLIRDYVTNTSNAVLKPAQVLSYQDYAFWKKVDAGYYLIVKGEMIQDHVDGEWKGSNLQITDRLTKSVYVIPDYENAVRNMISPATVARQ
ncbi:MAG: caspase domain-containing protein [Bacteroidales bacterium]